MKANVTASSGQPNGSERQSHTAEFTKVLDGRKQPIRGLWVRNGRYYARLAFEDEQTGKKEVRRVPLMGEDKNPVATVAQAVEAMRRLMVKRSENNLPVLRMTPKFSDFVQTYLKFIKAGGGDKVKKSATIEKEEITLGLWVKHLGETRIDHIRPSHINAYRTERLNAGKSKRTVNLDVTALRNLLKYAIAENWIKALPTATIRPFRCGEKKRPLFTVDQLEALCKAALDKNPDGSPVTKNGQQFVDYIRLLAYSGAREQEALSLRWDLNVNFSREQLTIGADGNTKNSDARIVDFNPKLKAHLQDMEKRKAPDSKWLFPSPQRGDKDIHAQTFRESLKLVRAHAKMEHIGFHDCRHHFISYAVMSGLDYMTIASWVGHKDGGILIGKVYGHLADEHKREQAQRLNFGPVVLQSTATI